MNGSTLLYHKLKIPDKLDVLMQRLTREILCQQPENIYEFAADFFDKLLQEGSSDGKSHFHPSRQMLLDVV